MGGGEHRGGEQWGACRVGQDLVLERVLVWGVELEGLAPNLAALGREGVEDPAWGLVGGFLVGNRIGVGFGGEVDQGTEMGLTGGHEAAGVGGHMGVVVWVFGRVEAAILAGAEPGLSVAVDRWVEESADVSAAFRAGEVE